MLFILVKDAIMYNGKNNFAKGTHALATVALYEKL